MRSQRIYDWGVMKCFRVRMRSKPAVMAAIVLLCWCKAFSQSTDSIRLYLGNVRLTSDTIDILDGKAEVGFEYVGQFKDSIRLTVVHHDGTSPFSRVSYIFREPKGVIELLNVGKIDSSDQLRFTFDVGGQKITRSLFVSSTSKQLNRPYFIDVYFVHNEDTVNTSNYVLPSRLKSTKNGKFVRLEFQDPKRIPKALSIKFGKVELNYDLQSYWRAKTFHARTVLRYVDKRKLRAKLGFSKSIDTKDLDSRQSFSTQFP